MKASSKTTSLTGTVCAHGLTVTSTEGTGFKINSKEKVRPLGLTEEITKGSTSMASSMVLVLPLGQTVKFTREVMPMINGTAMESSN